MIGQTISHYRVLEKPAEVGQECLAEDTRLSKLRPVWANKSVFVVSLLTVLLCFGDVLAQILDQEFDPESSTAPVGLSNRWNSKCISRSLEWKGICWVWEWKDLRS